MLLGSKGDFERISSNEDGLMSLLSLSSVGGADFVLDCYSVNIWEGTLERAGGSDPRPTDGTYFFSPSFTEGLF